VFSLCVSRATAQAIRLSTTLALIAVIVAACGAGGPPQGIAREGTQLGLVANVPLPGPSNRFDYTSIDSGANRLYIAHMDAGRLLVFDTKRRRMLQTIKVPGVHGVIAVPQLHRVYASATDARELYTIDSRSGKVTARAPAGSYPDGLVYDPVERRVFVSDENGGIEAVFNAAGHRIASVQLGGEAGNVQYDAGSGMILADVQTLNQVAIINPATTDVVRRIPLPGCDHSHGLLVDAPRRLAFIACDGNALLLTLDLERMKIAGRAKVGDGPDVLAFDTVSRRLYVAAESGEVAVFRERGRKLSKIGQGRVAPEAHTVAVDPQTHLVYFPLQSGTNGHPQLRVMQPGGADR
jgi:DNA-binding beta-propeller fold protein YncE